ncbi:MAG: hypothetical protein DRN20_00425 [Thermoplasmata archaeon]|nr:MAG: hypothetical protein DRN20_00425 [Thermoplasmata archaeon]
MHTFTNTKKDVVKMSNGEDIKKMIENLPEEAKKELESIGDFHHYVVCRYMLLRKALGLMEVTIDDESETIVAKTVSQDIEPIISTYTVDSQYSDFYGIISNDLRDVFFLPSYDEIEGVSVEDAAEKIGVRTNTLEDALKTLPSGIYRIVDKKVHFERDGYENLRAWVENNSNLEATTYNLSLLGIQGYTYDIDGVTDNTEIMKDIMRKIDHIMGIMEDRGIDMPSLPIEAYYLWAFIWALEEALSKHLGMDTAEFEKRILGE